MIRRFIGITALAAALALPALAQAQGVPGGVERGSREGERAAGPVGAVVGGVLGGVAGGVAGVLGVDQRPRFHSYVVERHYPSYRYDGDVRVFIDPKSFIYLNGMVLDYEETLMRQGFNFINPNSKKSCGCGSSFTA